MKIPFLNTKKIDSLAESAAPAGNEKLVELKDIRVIYNLGKTNEARAVNGVSLDIYPGEYVVFFGPSGCGKSTLLNIIAGLEIPTSGTVLIDGKELNKLSPNEISKFRRRRIGMVFQSYNLISTLSVFDNSILPQIFDRVPKKKRKERGRELLEKVGIDQFSRRLPQELSGGQQQRLGIARALINDPPIILADEAVGNLDSESAKNVLDVLGQLNRNEKKTIISVTHNPEHLHFADRVFYMKDGLVIKTEVNQKKKEEKDKLEGKARDEGEYKKERTALDLLLQSYPDLAGMQLHVMMAPFKAKVLANYLVSRFEGEEVERLEKLITSRLLGEVDKQALLRQLDVPFEKGGIGLNWSTALNFSKIIEEVVEKAEFLKKEQLLYEKGEADPLLEAISSLRVALLDVYHGEITMDQLGALEKGIEYRLLSKISRKEFQEFLGRSLAKGGAGFSRRTARNFAKKMEIVLLMEYGK